MINTKTHWIAAVLQQSELITTELIPPLVLNTKDPPEISGAAYISMAI